MLLSKSHAERVVLLLIPCSAFALTMLLASGCLSADEPDEKQVIAEAWKGMEGEWISYRGGGYDIKKISPKREVYQRFFLNGDQRGEQDNAMNLSIREGMLFYSKVDEKGGVVYESVYKLYNDRLYELNHSFKVGQSGKPNSSEFRRTTEPIETWLRAAREGDVQTLSRMLAEDHNPNATAAGSVNALTFAAANGKLDAIRLLVDKGADISAQSACYGTRALVEAAKFGQTDACKLLLELGANIQDGHNFRMTPLHETAYHGRLETARFLIAEGADLNATNNMGGTALHVAVSRAGGPNKGVRAGAAEVAKLLIAKGASQALKSKNGKTPLDIARENNLKELVTLLEK